MPRAYVSELHQSTHAHALHRPSCFAEKRPIAFTSEPNQLEVFSSNLERSKASRR